MLTHRLHGLATSHARCAALHGPHADDTFAFPPTRLTPEPEPDAEADVEVSTWGEVEAPNSETEAGEVEKPSAPVVVPVRVRLVAADIEVDEQGLA
jgi:hypothetical protein